MAFQLPLGNELPSVLPDDTGCPTERHTGRAQHTTQRNAQEAAVAIP